MQKLILWEVGEFLCLQFDLFFVGLAYQEGKDIVFRFIVDFGP